MTVFARPNTKINVVVCPLHSVRFSLGGVIDWFQSWNISAFVCNSCLMMYVCVMLVIPGMLQVAPAAVPTAIVMTEDVMGASIIFVMGAIKFLYHVICLVWCVDPVFWSMWYPF